MRKGSGWEKPVGFLAQIRSNLNCQLSLLLSQRDWNSVCFRCERSTYGSENTETAESPTRDRSQPRIVDSDQGPDDRKRSNSFFIARPLAKLWTHRIVNAVGTPRKAVFKAEMLGKHFIVVDPWGTTHLRRHHSEWVPN